MSRKMGFLARKVDVLEDVEELTRLPDLEPKEHLTFPADRKERLTFTGPGDWTPEQAEQYIDWRIHVVESEILRLREQIEVEAAKRRRWLSVTGGRSKIMGNGNGNGHGNGNGNGHGNGTTGE